MPARPWLVHFPDSQATVVEPRRDPPETGEELISGWVVTNAEPFGQSKLYELEIWVAPIARRRVVRQATDRRD